MLCTGCGDALQFIPHKLSDWTAGAPSSGLCCRLEINTGRSRLARHQDLLAPPLRVWLQLEHVFQVNVPPVVGHEGNPALGHGFVMVIG
jgi:hypothetical protein